MILVYNIRLRRPEIKPRTSAKKRILAQRFLLRGDFRSNHNGQAPKHLPEAWYGTYEIHRTMPENYYRSISVQLDCHVNNFFLFHMAK